MASMDKKEKKELMNKISSRIENENEKIVSAINEECDTKKLFNMVRQFKKALQIEYEQNESFINDDEELRLFFSDKVKNIVFMEKLVYKKEPNIFVNAVNEHVSGILQQLNICSDLKKNNKDVTKSYQEFIKRMADFDYFIKLFDNTDLMENDDIKNKVVESKKLIIEIEKILNNSAPHKQVDANDDNVQKNKNMALYSTINSYLVDLEERQSNILNGMDGEYTTNSDELIEYKKKIRELLKNIETNKISYNKAENQFDILQDEIKKRFNYSYKQEVKNRKRKIVSVRTLLLGPIGVAFGAYGISSILFELAHFFKYGIAYTSASIFSLPVLATIISGVMLKCAFSSKNEKRKNLAISVFEKFRNNHERSMQLVSENIDEELDESEKENYESENDTKIFELDNKKRR